MATIYRTNGETQSVTPKNRKYFQLKELQRIVGGYVENIYLNDGTIMVINEEGKRENLSLNIEATSIFRKNFPASNGFVIGDVLITERAYLK
ncbi:MAG: DUF3846 domain-containing protein [Prevotellaceae bacterium]|jgi:hypothetical protein|nr:DUF3846 domain-containing protein [Prevotellaceae bacterium]